MAEVKETVPIPVQCNHCGGGHKKHDVLFAEKSDWEDPETGEHGYVIYTVARCRGCETIRFVMTSWDTSSPYDPYDSETVRVFPDNASADRRTPALSQFDLPDKVGQMYAETLQAYDAGAHTLCGAGLRAIVEALCLDQGVAGGNLLKKIEALVAGGHLAKKQADHLHEERYLGNSAVHEMEKPSKSDLEDGLQIIEGLLKTIYILPVHAEGMKKRREARAAKKAATAAKSAKPAKTAAPAAASSSSSPAAGSKPSGTGALKKPKS